MNQKIPESISMKLNDMECFFLFLFFNEICSIDGHFDSGRHLWGRGRSREWRAWLDDDGPLSRTTTVCTFSFVCRPNKWKQETAIGATTECGRQVNFQSNKKQLSNYSNNFTKLQSNFPMNVQSGNLIHLNFEFTLS